MRKTIFAVFLSCSSGLLCIAALSTASIPLFAQEAAPAAAPAKEASPTLPSDPRELMLLAAKTNGLAGDDIKPWHLIISFKLFDEKGNTTDQGTFEEYWAGVHKHKIAYTSGRYSQTEYETDAGILLTGMPDAVPYSLAQVQTEFIHPVTFDEKRSKHSTFKAQQIELNGRVMQCVTETGHSDVSPTPVFVGPTYCLDADHPSLRSIMSVRWPPQSSLPVWGFTFNNIVSFQGYYVARDIESFRDNKLLFKARLESIEELKTFSDSDFAPQPGSLHVIRRVTIPEDVSRKLLLQHPKPVSPPIAQVARIYGDVVIEVIIGTDGHILSMRVLSGPAMLQQAALNAVKQWVYQPYLINGEAVQFVTTIKVSL